MPLKKLNNKTAALELSVGTIIIIVIGMSMLILGLILVKNIFGGATESVDELNIKIKNEITGLFASEEKNVVVKLGSQNTARIKQNTLSFNVPIGAATPDGSATTRERLKYKLSLDEEGSCFKEIGQARTERLLKAKTGVEYSFDEFDGSNAFALVEVSIPKGTSLCTQKVLIDVIDTETSAPVGGSFFKIEVIKSGIF